MVIRSVLRIHNSRSPKQIKDGYYESLKKTNSMLVSKRVHPRFRIVTTGFLSKDLVAGPQW